MRTQVTFVLVAAVLLALHAVVSRYSNVSSLLGGATGSLQERFLAQDDSVLARQLAVDSIKRSSEAAFTYNATVCAIITNEHAFIDEWIAYHYLLGIQQFHLYDFEASSTLEEKLLPYLEAGLVRLHTITYRDGRPSDNFHGRMLQHCSNEHAKHTNWLFQIDVDEYLRMSQIYGYSDRPYLSDNDTSSQVLFPLHDYLHSDRLREARCIPVTRDGTFRNAGVHDFEPYQSLLATQQYREAYRFLKHAGKVILRADKSGLLALFAGAHSCSVDSKAPHVNGIFDADRDAIRDSQGFVNKEGGDPGIPEPLRIAHFQERSLSDCVEKLDRQHFSPIRTRLLVLIDDNADIKDKNNWRVVNGGKEMCYRAYIPSASDLSSDYFEGHQYEETVKRMPTAVIVKDDSLASSWVGKRAIEYMAQLRKHGANRAIKPEEVKSQVVHIYID